MLNLKLACELLLVPIVRNSNRPRARSESGGFSGVTQFCIPGTRVRGLRGSIVARKTERSSHGSLKVRRGLVILNGYTISREKDELFPAAPFHGWWAVCGSEGISHDRSIFRCGSTKGRSGAQFLQHRPLSLYGAEAGNLSVDGSQPREISISWRFS